MRRENPMKLEEMSRLVAKGRINRREFVQLAMAAGLAAATAETMFSRAARADPKKGGRLRMALGHGSTTDTLDPANYVNNFTGTFAWGTLSNGLTEVDVKGNIQPDLAE